MSNFSIRPAIREQTPLIIGLAGPTKSGKTYSAHRLAKGLAKGGKIVMLNAEGARGHQYADKFSYLACDIEPPFRPTRYTEALQEIAKIEPAVVIVDSASHFHDGPGGMLEWHDEEAARIGGNDRKAQERATWAAWIRPKAAENQFIYAMLSMKCPIILAFRAKEKVKIVPGKQPIDLGWQPIASDRVSFETIFTLLLPPHSKGVPDMALSEMREPFDTMVPQDRQIDEQLGEQLRQWAAGGSSPKAAPARAPAEASSESPSGPSPSAPAAALATAEQITGILSECEQRGVNKGRLMAKLAVSGIKTMEQIPAHKVDAILEWVRK